MDRTPKQKVGDYLAALPYVIGHVPTQDHLVVTCFGYDRKSVVHLDLEWEPGTEPRSVARFVERALEDAEPIARAAVVGYGPEGHHRAADVADEINESLDIPTDTFHIAEGTWRILDRLTGGWSEPSPVPEAPPKHMLGRAAEPAASREDLYASVAPLPKPLFTKLDQRRAQHLDSLGPRTRSEIAVGALDDLATTRPGDPAHQQVLAHLATTDLVIRDVVLAHALDEDHHRARVDALIQTCRAAPPSLRPPLASLAAAATFLTAGHPPMVEGLLQNADPTSGLAYLIGCALRGGENPASIRPGAVEAAQDGLREAEDAWCASQRPRSPRPGSGPSTPQPAEQSTSGVEPPRL